MEHIPRDSTPAVNAVQSRPLSAPSPSVWLHCHALWVSSAHTRGRMERGSRHTGAKSWQRPRQLQQSWGQSGPSAHPQSLTALHGHPDNTLSSPPTSPTTGANHIRKALNKSIFVVDSLQFTIAGLFIGPFEQNGWNKRFPKINYVNVTESAYFWE